MKLRFLLCLVAAVSAGTALAWDNEGHMMVAEIAWTKLTPQSRTRVTQLLMLNPDYQSWIVGVAASDRDQIAFVRAATWPDAIKGKPDYQYDGDTPPDGTAAGQNIGYADKFQHRYWHFIDTPFSTDGTSLVQPIPPNAETQIELFQTAIAAASTSDEIKSYDLVWLEHLVGDVHQPLHATSRFSAALPNGDRGGNSVRLTPACGTCPDDLHAVWDDALGNSNSAATAIAKADHAPQAPAGLAQLADVSTWIEESFQAAKLHVYVSPVGPGTGPFKLTTAYNRAEHAEAKSRIELAGARLANLINANLN